MFLGLKMRPCGKALCPCGAPATLIQGIPERPVQRPEPDKLGSCQNAFLRASLSRAIIKGELQGQMPPATAFLEEKEAQASNTLSRAAEIPIFQSGTLRIATFFEYDAETSSRMAIHSCFCREHRGIRLSARALRTGERQAKSAKGLAKLFLQTRRLPPFENALPQSRAVQKWHSIFQHIFSLAWKTVSAVNKAMSNDKLDWRFRYPPGPLSYDSGESRYFPFPTMGTRQGVLNFPQAASPYSACASISTLPSQQEITTRTPEDNQKRPAHPRTGRM